MRADFRPLRAWEDGWTKRTDGRKDGQTQVPLCSRGICPLSGRCPASAHSISQSCKVGQWVSPGHFLVIFFAEPTGLSPLNSTEPDGKTASPAKKRKQCWIEGYLHRVWVGRGSEKICQKTFFRRSDVKITCECKKKVSLTNRAIDGLMNGQSNRRTDRQMDRPPNTVGFKVACKRLEKLNILLHFSKTCEPQNTVIFLIISLIINRFYRKQKSSHANFLYH